MKRAMPWIDKEDDSSSDDSSASESDTAEIKPKGQSKAPEGKSGKRRSNVVDFDALKRHGFKGGPSVLRVPPPKEPEKQDWSWSTGKEKREDNKESDESYQERQKTRAAIAEGEQLRTALTRNDKKNLSFAQKERRKRELGQASRGKNYVEEEKRLLRDSGVYSGFDA
ncbi:hypothetical protein TIFTF001_046651 [Ficus carica]|uniref:Uncharacterized protein n=1 Tax=Ficus carica TaxID=3494 RepID=A0AA87ZJ24_FICCA|nr:hypothetical protein TIFTF001_046651 [Ficus carica]